jgi:hypothetical protein
MIEWYTTHYWMTFWIIIFLLIVIDSTVCNIANAISNKYVVENNKVKLKFKEIEEGEKDERN